MMTMDQQLPPTTRDGIAESPALASFWSGLAVWVRACGDAYAASATYEDLSRLSDAELQRRGLSRETLAREVFKSCGRRD